jgi:hypothetical protein
MTVAVWVKKDDLQNTKIAIVQKSWFEVDRINISCLPSGIQIHDTFHQLFNDSH